MGTNSDVVSPGLRSYLTGFALAVPLTVIPFALAATGYFPNAVTLRVIAIAAIAQVLVHLRYFLHLSFSPKNTWFLIAVAFTAVILLIMVGGTIWILFELNRHMLLLDNP